MLRQQKDLVGRLRKWQFLLTFSTAFMLTYWVGGSEKVQKCADVIYGWLLWQIIQTAVSFLQPKFMLVKAVNELDFKSLFIRPTGISGLTGGGISPANTTLLVLEIRATKNKFPSNVLCAGFLH
jgi:hypothetical protein